MKSIKYFIFGSMLLGLLIWGCEKNTQENGSEGKESASLKQRSDVDFCFDDDGCTPFSTNPTTWYQIPLPAYEPCKADVTFDVRVCPVPGGGSSVRYVFINFSAVPHPDTNCQYLINRWDSLESASNYTLLNQEIDAFHRAARDATQKRFFELFFQSTANQNGYPCGGTALLFGEFHTSLCFKWCVVFNGGSPPSVSLEKLICGTQCCEEKTPWCWNGVPVQGSKSYTESGSCDTNSTLDPCTSTPIGDCDAHSCAP